MFRRCGLAFCEKVTTKPLTGASFALFGNNDAKKLYEEAEKKRLAEAAEADARATLVIDRVEAHPDTPSSSSSGESPPTTTNTRPPGPAENAVGRTQQTQVTTAAEFPAETGTWQDKVKFAYIPPAFKDIPMESYLEPIPTSFLTPRALTDVQPAEAVLQSEVVRFAEMYKGVDVRDPTTVAGYYGDLKPGEVHTYGQQVKSVSMFVAGHLAHHTSLVEWRELFDIKYSEMDLTFWLYVLHFQMIARRLNSVDVEINSRKREIFEEIGILMFEAWEQTAERVIGRPPGMKICSHFRSIHFVNGLNFEEALLCEGPGQDMKLLGFLLKFCPLPRPEDIPMYTYYTLVHYIRFHIALFDRIPDEQFMIGNFNFLSPKDPEIFLKYTDIDLDTVVRGWEAEGVSVGGEFAEAFGGGKKEPHSTETGEGPDAKKETE